ncbi:ROK family transcriptional regulator [Kineosporia sp. J2-2]|uniref:ROK family transcriptional regulator n=1 Tax=Kineosporia corallincola TaxID=2835133 RepID=A0ABS5TDA9_9ACTN|nr:ROK family transcriptional regulator [Kineosporia corallincola]MBT0769070.1 ROK family transcriptional regulator [Kineosporia corallincola]
MSILPGTRGLSALRSSNRRRLLDLLREHGEISRADLARLTDLSATTVSSLISELSDEGVVSEVGLDERRNGRTGRPGRLVQLVGGRRLVVGLDVGRDVVRAALCDLSGAVVSEQTRGIDMDDAESLTQVSAFVNELIDQAAGGRERISRLVVAVPGVVESGTGYVSSVWVPNWLHVAPGPVLAAATGLETFVENDADLCALGERSFGAALGLNDVLHVKASSGIGIGLVLAGRLYRGSHGGAGELGHVQVADFGDLCLCGNRGCLETLASLEAVLSALRVVRPGVRTAAHLADLVRDGDRAAIRVVTDAGAVIGKQVAALCNVLAPQAVVVGGELAGGGTHLADAVRDAVERYTKPRTAARIAVLPAELGTRAAVLGAVTTAVEAELTA